MNIGEAKQILAEGIQHHQAGRFEPARICYEQALTLDSENAVAAHLMGVLASQLGNAPDAIQWMRSAIAANDRVPDFFRDLGMLYKVAGRLEDAIACYRRALELEPSHADTLFNLGNSLRDAGNAAEAEACYRKSLDISPGAADALYNLGIVLQDQGRWEAAASAYSDALEAGPSPMIHNNLGVVCMELGDAARAARHLRMALELDSSFVEAAVNLGHLLKCQGDKKTAESCYRQAIALAPDHANALYHLGILLLDMQRPKDAIAPLRRASQLDGVHSDAWYFLGLACSDVQSWHEAADAFQKCLALRRKSRELQAGCYEAALNLANVLKEMGRMDEAIALYRQTAAWQPDNTGALNNLGAALLDVGLIRDAQPLLERAVRVEPAYADARCNLGNLQLAQANLTSAVACYREAIRLKPAMAQAHLNLAVALLLAGDFKSAWNEFQWRWDWEAASSRYAALPRWRGEPLEGKTILLHEEQGFGDSIQFIRYATWTASLGARVIVETYPPLAELIRTVPGVAEVIPMGSPLPACDFHASLLSLAGMHGTDFSNIPASVPYMIAPERAMPGLTHGGEFKVGVVWAGKPKPTPRRSIPLGMLAPIFEIPGLTFFSLQVGNASVDLRSIKAPIIDLSPYLTDYADTAAAIAQLDLVVSVDTSVAHLAGALGKPVWTLLMHSPDWRWWLGRSDSPWYPTMRLFRQTEPDDWADVVSRLSEALHALKK